VNKAIGSDSELDTIEEHEDGRDEPVGDVADKSNERMVLGDKRRFSFPGPEITEYLKTISDNFRKSF